MEEDVQESKKKIELNQSLKPGPDWRTVYKDHAVYPHAIPSGGI